MRFRTLIALTTVAAAGLAACGGGDDDNLTTSDRRDDGESSVGADSGPGQSLRRIETAKDTTSASDDLDFVGTFEFGANGESASFTMEGTSNATTGAARFEMSFDAPGLSGDPLELVSDGELIWMSADGELWYELTVDELGDGSATGTDPAAFLALLDEVGDVEDVGTEQIDGVETTHYHAETDVEQFLASQGVDVGEFDGLDSSSMPIDVWIDGDDLIRQVELEMELTAGDFTATAGFQFNITPAAEPVEITGPPAGEIVEGSPADLGALIAGS